MATRIILLLLLLASSLQAQIKITTTDWEIVKQRCQIGTDTSKYYTSISNTINSGSTYRQGTNAKAVYDFVTSLGYVYHDLTLDGTGTIGSPLSIAQQSATSGQVLKWNGTAWAPATDAGGTYNQTLYDEGSAATQRTGVDFRQTTIINPILTDDSGNNQTDVTFAVRMNSITDFEIAPNAITSSELANDVVDSTKVINGGLSVKDIGQHGATTGQVLKWNGTQWAPQADATGSAGHTIKYNGSSMTARTNLDFISTSTITAAGTDNSGANSTELRFTIPTDGVTATQIATDAVGSAEIAANAVGSSELASTAVTAGSYTYASVTVDVDGRLTSASSGTAPPTASGTTNYVSKFTGSTALGNSQIFDSGTAVGIGTATPDTTLTVKTNTTGESSPYRSAISLFDLNGSSWGGASTGIAFMSPNNFSATPVKRAGIHMSTSTGDGHSELRFNILNSSTYIDPLRLINTGQVMLPSYTGGVFTGTVASYLATKSDGSVLDLSPSSMKATINYWTLTGSDIYYSSGKVGIGSNGSSANVDSTLTILTNTSSDSYNYHAGINLHDSNSGGLGGYSTGIIFSGPIASFNSNPLKRSGIHAFSDGSGNNFLSVNLNSNGWTGTYTERLRVTQSGYFGFGTSTPVNIVDIEGGIAIGSTYSGSSTAPSNGAIIEGALGVGIASSLAAKVQIKGAGSTSGDYTLIATNSSGTTSTATLVLRGDNKVGIGTNSPSATLHIAGDTRTDGLLQSRGTGNGTSSTSASDLRLYNTTGGTGTIWDIESADGGDLNIYAGGSNQTVRIESSTHSIAEGDYADAALWGQSAHAAGRFAADGDAQAFELVWRGSFTGTGGGELFLDGSSVRAALPSNTVWSGRIDATVIITAQGNGSISTGSVLSNSFNLACKKIGTTTSAVPNSGQAIASFADTGMDTIGEITATADDTTDALKVLFTAPSGAGSTTTFRAVAVFRATQIKY